MCKMRVLLPLGGERIIEHAGAMRRPPPHIFGEGKHDAKQASEQKQSIIRMKVQIQGDTAQI